MLGTWWEHAGNMLGTCWEKTISITLNLARIHIRSLRAACFCRSWIGFFAIKLLYLHQMVLDDDDLVLLGESLLFECKDWIKWYQKQLYSITEYRGKEGFLPKTHKSLKIKSREDKFLILEIGNGLELFRSCCTQNTFQKLCICQRFSFLSILFWIELEGNNATINCCTTAWRDLRSQLTLLKYCNHGNYNEVPFITFITSCSTTLSNLLFQLYGA